MFNLEEAIKSALKAKDQAALAAWRSLKTKVMVKLTESGREQGKALTEEELQACARREIKERQESNQFLKAGDPEMEENEKIISLLSDLLPAQLSDEDTEALIRRVLDEVNPEGPKDMGKVMGALKQASNALDMKVASEKVRAILAERG